VTAGSVGDGVLAAAEAAVAAFVACRPGYTIDADQPAYRGGTNRVTFGARAGAPVVLKHFVQPWRWQNERFCLRHFAATGCVPLILDEAPPRLLVLTRLAGRDLDLTGLGAAGVAGLSREVGRALGRLAGTPLPDPDPPPAGEGDYDARPQDFDSLPWDQDRPEVVAGYLEPCRRIQRGIPAYRAAFLARSLDLLEAQLAGLPGQRRVLFHEDIANLRTAGARFLGFYDLEMCRLGREAMQLGVALGLCGSAGLRWPVLLEGYAAQTAPGRRGGPPLPEPPAVLAMHHLYHWQRICRWGEWDGDPAAVALRRASEAGARTHLRAMRAAYRVLRVSPPVAAWFART
jgi:hypothetical protein